MKGESGTRDEVLAGGGEMGALLRSIDWARTPVGPVGGWPQSLRSLLSLLLASPSPVFLWWGPEFIQFYNDAYRPIMGGLHPQGMGQRGPDCWGEAWKIVYPRVEAAMERGEASSILDGMLPLVRHGFVEECYFSYTFTPVRDESGKVGGIYCAVTETTQRVLGERRMRMLRELSIRTAAARNVELEAASCWRGCAPTCSWPGCGGKWRGRKRCPPRCVRRCGPGMTSSRWPATS